MMLLCKDCGAEFERRKKFGLAPTRCPTCRLDKILDAHRAYQKRRYHGDPEFREKHLARTRAWYSKPENRAKRRAADNAYNAAHPDRNSRIGKSWRERNPDKVKAYNLLRKQRKQQSQLESSP